MKKKKQAGGEIGNLQVSKNIFREIKHLSFPNNDPKTSTKG